MSGSVGQAVVVENEGTWVQLPDAQLWFLNSDGVRVTLQACPPATISVTPA